MNLQVGEPRWAALGPNISWLHFGNISDQAGQVLDEFWTDRHEPVQ